MMQKSGKHIAILAVFWLLSTFVASCSSEEEDYGPDQTEEREPDPIGNERPLPPATSITCPSGTYLTYNNFGGAFLNNYCTSCHHSQLPEADRQGAPLEANFDSAYLAQVWRASIILKAVGEAPTMPPAQAVPTQERRELSEWLNCGAPEK